jgi:GT2 family glycosyltransferase
MLLSRQRDIATPASPAAARIRASPIVKGWDRARLGCASPGRWISLAGSDATGGTGMAGEDRMRIGVVIATLGRPQEAAQVLGRLRAQSLPPARIVFSVEQMQDLPPGRTPGGVDPDVEVALGTRGLCAQRNRGMARVLDDCEVVVFYDDDFLPSRRSLEGVAELFAAHPDVVGATGRVLADGVSSGGVAWDEGGALVDAYDAAPDTPPWTLADLGWTYGCNMAFRCRAARDLRFDERLPLYGWQEDVDFGGQIARRGRVVRTNAFAGVHLGVAKSRTPGVRLGFSQMVNPVYLVRKGTMRAGHAARIMSRNLIANHLRALAPEPHIDRRGRLVGNWRGLLHLAAGRIDPERIWSLP